MEIKEIRHLVYYGINLGGAYQNCISDSFSYEEGYYYDIVSCRRLRENLKVGFSSDLMEAWEFEVFLTPNISSSENAVFSKKHSI